MASRKTQATDRLMDILGKKQEKEEVSFNFSQKTIESIKKNIRLMHVEDMERINKLPSLRIVSDDSDVKKTSDSSKLDVSFSTIGSLSSTSIPILNMSQSTNIYEDNDSVSSSEESDDDSFEVEEEEDPFDVEYIMERELIHEIDVKLGDIIVA